MYSDQVTVTRERMIKINSGLKKLNIFDFIEKCKRIHKQMDGEFCYAYIFETKSYFLEFMIQVGREDIYYILDREGRDDIKHQLIMYPSKERRSIL